MVKCCAKEDVGFEVGTTLAITALEQKLSPLLLPLLILPICHFISYMIFQYRLSHVFFYVFWLAFACLSDVWPKGLLVARLWSKQLFQTIEKQSGSTKSFQFPNHQLTIPELNINPNCNAKKVNITEAQHKGSCTYYVITDRGGLAKWLQYYIGMALQNDYSITKGWSGKWLQYTMNLGLLH